MKFFYIILLSAFCFGSISCSKKKVRLVPESLKDAAAFVKEGQFKKAAKIYQSKLAENPNDFNAWWGYAEVSFLRRDFIALKEVSLQMLKKFPEKSQSHFYFGVAKAEGNYQQIPAEDQKALSYISKSISLSPNEGLYYAYRGIVQYRLRNIQPAIDDFSFALESGQLDSYSALVLSRVLCWYVLDPKIAENLGQLSIRLKEDYPLASFSEESIACASFLNDDFEASKKVYLRILEKDQRNFNALYDFSRVHLRLKNYKEANKLLDQMITLENTPRKLKGKAFFLKGFSLYKNGDLNGALKNIESSIKLRPGKGHYILFEAEVLSRLGKESDRKASLSKLDDLNLDYFWVLHNLAFFLYKAGDLGLSLEYVNKSLGSKPHFIPALSLGRLIALKLKDDKKEKEFDQKYLEAAKKTE